MINVKIVKKAKGKATASSGSGGSSSVVISQQGTVNDARHAKQADEATIAQRAYNADNADRAAYADRAGIADRATSLSPDSPEFNKFLRKDIDDEAAGNVTFDQTIDVKGNTTLEGDLDARGSVTHGGTTVHQGQTTHNALTRFNQDAEIPTDSTERVMGTIKFMAQPHHRREATSTETETHSSRHSMSKGEPTLREWHISMSSSPKPRPGKPRTSSTAMTDTD